MKSRSYKNSPVAISLDVAKDRNWDVASTREIRHPVSLVCRWRFGEFRKAESELKYYFAGPPWGTVVLVSGWRSSTEQLDRRLVNHCQMTGGGGSVASVSAAMR